MQQIPLARHTAPTPPATSTAAIAHELNNVLATISGYGTFVRDELAGGDAAAFDVKQMLEDAQVVLDATRRGAELTAQLMKLDGASVTPLEARIQ